MELSKEANALFERVKRKPLSLYWGRGGWCPSLLPKGIKRIHFNELMNSGKVTVKMACVVPNIKINGGR